MNNKKLQNICIVGLGYVGLPLALEASKKFNVYAYDNNPKIINNLNKKKTFLVDLDLHTLKKNINKTFRPTKNIKSIGYCDYIIICLPTPLNKNKDPDLSYVTNFLNSSSKYFKKKQTIILESTTFPGTTDEILKPFFESKKLRIGKDIFLGYSPERIDPGRKIKINQINKICSGYSDNCKKKVFNFYKNIFENVMLVSSNKVAEMSKLYENIFRNINIGLVNELKIICDRLDIDIREVIKAASTKQYGFMRFSPGPGIGGHCIPIDPFYLTWKAKEKDMHTRFIELAAEINSAMPDWIISKIMNILNKNSYTIKNSKFLIMGVAYKKNVADTRETPAFKIIEKLSKNGAKVSYYDPHVTKIEIKNIRKKMKSINSKDFKNKKFDFGVLITDHDDVNYKNIYKNFKIIFDSRNKLENNRKVIQV